MGYYDNERADPYQLKLRKGRFSKIMITAIAIALLLFTAATFLVAMSGNYVPDALIYCFFGAALGEFWALAFVKKSKTENEAERSEQDAIYRAYGADAATETAAGEREYTSRAAEAGAADEEFPAGRRL